jgi:signal transduction histidine kinase
VWEGAHVKPGNALLGLAGVGLGVGSLVIARHDPTESFGGRSVAGGIMLLGAGWSVIACGLVARARRPSSRLGVLLAAAGCAWFLAEFDSPGVGSPVVFTLGLVTYAACPALVAHAALAYPDGRLGRGARAAAVALAYLATIGVLGVLVALAFDPAAQGCSLCAHDLLTVANGPTSVTALNRIGVVLGLAWAPALAALALWKIARSSPAARLVSVPVLAPGAAYLGLVAADYAHALHRGFLSNDEADSALWGAQGAALIAVALGVAFAWVRGRRARGAMARLVVQLDQAPAGGGLRDALAQALGDPQLELAYPVGEGVNVDAAGRPVRLRPRTGRRVTVLVRDNRAVAMLGHRAELLDEPGLVDEVGAAARLALDHERLQAELNTQLAALRASRARTIEVGDLERRRLERDLHDGAQQRLVALAMALQLLRGQVSPAATRRVTAAESELRAALDDLRELGRGIYPAVLVDEGLAAAVESLAEDGHVAMSIGPMPERRLPPPLEAAAYFLISEVAKRSSAPSLAVSAQLSEGRLRIELSAAGTLHDDLVDLEDRIGALDGEMTIERAADRVAIRAEVPCES